MNIVLRCNYGDESIAAIQWLHEHFFEQAAAITVCYIDTGWSAATWLERVCLGESLAQRYGFATVRLKAPIDFASLAKQKNGLPNQKFQWCAGFLKGIPFLDWLDQVDFQGQWLVAIPKRQLLYRKPIPEYINQCEHHGDRKVWHPLVGLDVQKRNKLLESAGFEPLNHRSLECDPCVNARLCEIQAMSQYDLDKAQQLEDELKLCFYPKYNQKIKQVANTGNKNLIETFSMDSFSMGCGDPFGCGL